MKLNLDHIKAEANAIVEDSLLAKIELTNITHTMIGGYNARAYSKELDLMEGLRTSEVKGTWRWWLRAALAGALWDLQKEPRQTVIRSIVKEIMGSTASASKITIAASHPYVEGRKAVELRDIPRMKLISMGKGDEAQEHIIYTPGSLNAALLIQERAGVKLDRTSRRMAFGTLLLALLQGVGAITRRGFGRFQVTISSFADELRDYSEIIDAINRAGNREEMQRQLEALCSKVLDDVKEKLQGSNMLETIAARSSRLPPIPSLSKDSQVFKLRVLDVKAREESELLQKLGTASMKVSWKAALGLNTRDIGGVLDTWILGLPREVRKTGYSSTEGRRPSAIMFSPIRKLEQSFLVAIFGFLSTDWPIDGLQWTSGTRGQYQVANISAARQLSATLYRIRDANMRKQIEECVNQRGEARIKCAFNIAFDLVERQLSGRI
jgi:CRISPR type III-B/RAMP module RAMP protein Cmr1